jgi:Domain of unknown function (DUF4145)
MMAIINSRPQPWKLDCGFCGISAKPAEDVSVNHGQYKVRVIKCAGCFEDTIIAFKFGNIQHNGNSIWAQRLWPISGRSPKAFKNTAPELVKDYGEACAVLSLSPKSSAALARRVLQSVLKKQNYASKDLANQIDAILNEQDGSKRLPTYISNSLDAVRNYGNFSAHRITDATTLQLIDVEEGEAEWCCDLVELLFDHFYERPAIEKDRIDALNAKLANAGKPEAKR